MKDAPLMEDYSIIQLTEPIEDYQGVDDAQAVGNASIVISDDGVVVKDRGGMVPRRPTIAEREAAQVVSPKQRRRRKTDK